MGTAVIDIDNCPSRGGDMGAFYPFSFFLLTLTLKGREKCKFLAPIIGVVQFTSGARVIDVFFCFMASHIVVLKRL